MLADGDSGNRNRVKGSSKRVGAGRGVSPRPEAPFVAILGTLAGLTVGSDEDTTLSWMGWGFVRV